MADEFVELVWENGQILMHGRSITPSCISYSSLQPLDKNITGEIYTSKRPRLATQNSVLDLNNSPLVDLPDRKDLSKNQRSAQDDHHSDRLFPSLYKNNFDIFLGATQDSAFDEHPTESQIVPECEDENLMLRNNPSPVEIPQLRINGSGQSCKSSFQQGQASISIGKSIATGSQIMSSICKIHNSNSQQLNSRPDKDLVLRNFSLSLRPTQLRKADDQHQAAIESAEGPSSLRVHDLKSNEDGDKALVTEPTSDPRSSKNFQKHQALVTIKTDQIQQIANASEESPMDEQSEAPSRRYATKSKRFHDRVPSSASSLPANTVKGKPEREEPKDELVATTSLCSWGASNDLSNSALRRENKDNEAMWSPSENDEGDQQVPRSAFARSGGKRRRREVHKQSERKRRDKITKKMRALQALIPNSGKVDTLSVLDNAIEYLKTLQLQLQIMSQGTGFCMPPMMVPIGMQPTQLRATNLSHFPTMWLPMGVRMPMGVGCIPAILSNSAMLGLQAGPMLPMPFIPHVSAISGAATAVELMRSASALSSNDALVKKINSETIKQL